MPAGPCEKGNGCQPPGQAKAAAPAKIAAPDDIETAIRSYTRGDLLPDDYVLLFDPKTIPLLPGTLLVRSGDYLYLLDRVSGTILNPIGSRQDWDWAWQDSVFKTCPPGLAKKNPPCVPPGLAKAGPPAPYPVHARLPDGYQVVIDPSRFDPNDQAIYTRLGDQIYRVDPQTKQVIDVIGTISDLLQ